VSRSRSSEWENAHRQLLYSEATFLFWPRPWRLLFRDGFQAIRLDHCKEIRARIFKETKLPASAGIAEKKMLAKIASDWTKHS
jgi:nucleotidyltransferase/DNA polymerase involved in DNA repair